METRLIIAYSLIAILVIVLAWWVAHSRYNTRDRKIARQRGREADVRVKRIQEQAERSQG